MADKLKHLEVPLNVWSAMTTQEKQKHLAKLLSVKSTGASAIAFDLQDQEPGSSGCTEKTLTIGNFEDSGLPECLRGSWINASKIVELQDTANHPNDPSKRVTISLSGPTTQTIQIGKRRNKITCDENCPRFKEMAICCHTIAVAHFEGSLNEFVSSYLLPVNRLVRSAIPICIGKKANERGSKRRRNNNGLRDLADDLIKGTNVQDTERSNDLYDLMFVKNTAGTTSYGCKGRVRNK